MNPGEKVARSFIIPRGDGAKLFEFAEEVLDQVARLIEVFVIVARIFSVAFGRDDSALTGFLKRIDHAFIGIERFIGDHGIGLDGGKKRIGAVQIMSLARREQEVSRIAQCIDGGVDFGAQSPSAAPNGLVRAIFLSAPALC